MLECPSPSTGTGFATLSDLRAVVPQAALIGPSLTGTASQIEWATQIKPRAAAEFDRVATALKTVADRQLEPKRSDTLQLLDILAEKRAEVMARPEAGYFIQHWQELGGRVQGLLIADPRYLELKTRQRNRPAAPLAAKQ